MPIWKGWRGRGKRRREREKREIDVGRSSKEPMDYLPNTQLLLAATTLDWSSL